MLSVYRREWQGSVFSGFIEPLVVLAGLGIGLGVLVGDKAAEITGGVSYVAYIAPALMISSAMNLATSEAAWPILARVAWVRIYHAMVATPLKDVAKADKIALYVGRRILQRVANPRLGRQIHLLLCLSQSQKERFQVSLYIYIDVLGSGGSRRRALHKRSNTNRGAIC